MNWFSKEPVLLGAALTVTADGVALVAGASEATQAILHGIVVAWVAWIVRSLSTPEAKVGERVAVVAELERNRALADVASLAAKPVKKAPVKRAAK